ncbi:PLP-dependent aspartate aminotransferase family protein [Paraflavitalea sp. CAU 1676]|uniref:trans-sulfuration enzyme family protein n=1 Tax=Paraflavitalea sp. CAU 1676 TaxID=3032598 RepID=UPI0023DB822D|nr:PLP-dependent aspartate aminotransferase family protein [Paraflavitalea sp. CAU 1676]MDF2187198.1 PLP-dependent aspartate aminotransferase family protein [Paraflavitalea sp. CAU 1676]
MMPDNDLSYILNELGEDREQYFRAIAPPIMQTSNFAFKRVEELRKVFEDEYSNYLYTRGLNPTIDILRKKLAALDRAEDCLVFNSGASAIFASVFANVQSGDHIVSVKKPYTWAQKMFDNALPRFGVNTTYVDGTQIENFERAILPNTKVIYLESPNSWDYALQDLRAVAELARAEGIVTICDNSYSTPLFQKPIEMGIDMVLQSATKYIGGHSDVVAGVLSGTRDMMKKIFDNELLNMGNGVSPFNAWLLIRGLRTLPARLDRISQSTRKVIAYLQQHPMVEEVIFPLDEGFAQYELARKQMTGACGLLTIVMRAKKMDEIVTFCESLRHIMMAVSWGGYESLAIPRCASVQPDQFDAAEREHRMIRFYIGLEEPDYLVADIEQAFAAVH